jgi:hypothetical protein
LSLGADDASRAGAPRRRRGAARVRSLGSLRCSGSRRGCTGYSPRSRKARAGGRGGREVGGVAAWARTGVGAGVEDHDSRASRWGTSAFVARARTWDGRDVVVKLGIPDAGFARQVETLEAAKGCRRSRSTPAASRSQGCSAHHRPTSRTVQRCRRSPPLPGERCFGSRGRIRSPQRTVDSLGAAVRSGTLAPPLR